MNYLLFCLTMAFLFASCHLQFTNYDEIKTYFQGYSMTDVDSAINPDLNKRFLMMINALKENDNPVVVVVRMKK